MSKEIVPENTCATLDITPKPHVLEEIRSKIKAIAEHTLFLVHFYQPTWIKRCLRECGAEIVEADSQVLAAQGQASKKQILFCITVPFMAGSSAILARPEQKVVLADFEAGCSLETSAPDGLVSYMLKHVLAIDSDFVPVCYTNVGAETKAVVGDYDGIICTSSNAIEAACWVLARGKKPIFLPDRHLGDNVASELGIKEIAYWEYDSTRRHLPDKEVQQAKMLIWTGQCSVHTKLEVAVVCDFINRNPNGHIILHPEVPNKDIRYCLKLLGRDRVGVGSTRFIKQKLEELSKKFPGIAVAIATESNFVQELVDEYFGKLKVEHAFRNICACVHMRTRAELLLSALNAVVGNDLDNSVHYVTLPQNIRQSAQKALQRSMELQNRAFSLDWPF